MGLTKMIILFLVSTKSVTCKKAVIIKQYNNIDSTFTKREQHLFDNILLESIF